MLSGEESKVFDYHNSTHDRDENYTIYYDWTGKQDYKNNTTTVTVNVYISSDYFYLLYRDCSLTINGKKYEFQLPLRFEIYSYAGIPKLLVYTATQEIKHDENGEATFYIKAFWEYNQGVKDSLFNTYTLNKIDRKAPEVSITSVSEVGMSGFVLSAKSSISSNGWCYSLDGGTTWIAADGEARGITLRIEGLSKETEYLICVKCKRTLNDVYGFSQTVAVKTIGSTILNSATFSDVDNDVVTGIVNLDILDEHYHKLTIAYEGKEVLTKILSSVQTGDNEVVFTPEERYKILTEMQNKKTGLFSVSIKTYLDEGFTNQLSSVSSVMVMLTTTEKSKPIFTDFSYEDVVQIVTEVTGNNQVLVQKYSNLVVHCVEATPVNEATIKSYEASISKSFAKSQTTEIDIGSILEDGEFDLSVTCTDSRGYTTTVTKTVRVISYDDPNLNSISLRRKNEVDRIVELSFRGAFSKIDADGENDTNRLTEAKYRYKLKSEEEYGEYVNILDKLSINNNNFSFESNELEELEVEHTYDFQIVVKDRLGSLSLFEINLVLNKLTPAIAIRTANSQYPYTRVGINNNSPQYALDVGGEIAMNGGLILGYCGTLKEGETIRSKMIGGVYLYDASYEASDAPEKTPAIIKAVYAGAFSVIFFITLNENCSVYVTSYTGGSWSNWKKLKEDM